MADDRVNEHSKDEDLAKATVDPAPELTDDIGHRISDDQNSLRAGPRGPTLMEDFHFREKIMHFDHERIPERVVHARGTGAHGYFQLYNSLERYSSAKVLTDTSTKTPVFVRFSTVVGFRGSADTARDVRGFAVKFYTEEGNWDLVGNNIPVFFIQDAIKFPDLIHAAKPEPNTEIPQAQTAHDTFWDFISLTPESMHMIMWVMSDRAIPRSYRMMEGFGVHTFRLVNAQGKSHFVKFHWKPKLGVHSLVWDEAQKIAGKDPDFHRRDLYEAIGMGKFPEWELGMQILAEGDEDKFDFDILDATKIIPEDLIPVQRVGKMTLDRIPDNFFAEVEQVAFCTSNVVQGIDFTDDPLLQGRNFSYMDTQLKRLGSPNWPELPINRPLARVSNNQRDGHMRYTINRGRVSYEPNRLGGNIPNQVPPSKGGFASYPEQVSGPKVRVRSETFNDHYGQARLFWNSMKPIEKEHITKALQFELSKCDTREVRQAMLDQLQQINEVLAAQVALALGEPVKTDQPTAPPNGTADSNAETAVLANATSPTSASGGLQKAKALSMEEGQPRLPEGRKVAILAAAGVAASQVNALMKALKDAGSAADVVGPHLGPLVDNNDGANGGGSSGAIVATKTFANTDMVLYDAVFVPGGAQSVMSLIQKGDAHVFIDEAYKHAKPIAAVAEGIELLTASEIGMLLQAGSGAAPESATPTPAITSTPTVGVQNLSEVGRVLQANGPSAGDLAKIGIIVGQSGDLQDVIKRFLDAIAHHRFWGRPRLEQVPA
ncbi:MAG: catalase [Kouleothrix sp.]|nr:catalase [Kouleothrix sp.]